MNQFESVCIKIIIMEDYGLTPHPCFNADLVLGGKEKRKGN